MRELAARQKGTMRKPFRNRTFKRRDACHKGQATERARCAPSRDPLSGAAMLMIRKTNLSVMNQGAEPLIRRKFDLSRISVIMRLDHWAISKNRPMV